MSQRRNDTGIRPTAVLVLAAGRGTRMNNGLPKVLHPLAGQPLLWHVLDLARGLDPQWLGVVVGESGDAVADAARQRVAGIEIVVQDPPRGTGDAVRAALARLPEAGPLLVLYGDTPLLRAESLRHLLGTWRARRAAVGVLAFRPEDPAGYGRLRLGTDGELLEIVEERHAGEALRRTAPCNSGVMVLELAALGPLLAELPLRPEKGEYYLTDIVQLARRRGLSAIAVEAGAREGLGANCQRELARLEALWQEEKRARLLDAGVIMPAPETVHFAADTEIAPGARIEPYVVFGPGVRVETGAVVRSFSHLEGALIEAGATVGPFARLRPGTRLGPGARVGNFVEAKNAEFGRGAKANHLSYLGDVRVGAGANVGAGTITCNYDGFAKHRTEIGAGAFIGSNTALVAPVAVGAEAIVGAGSTIVEDVPDGALAIARGRQRTMPGRAARVRDRLRRRGRRNEEGG